MFLMTMSLEEQDSFSDWCRNLERVEEVNVYVAESELIDVSANSVLG